MVCLLGQKRMRGSKALAPLFVGHRTIVRWRLKHCSLVLETCFDDWRTQVVGKSIPFHPCTHQYLSALPDGCG